MSIGILLLSIAALITAAGIITYIVNAINDDTELSLKSIFWGKCDE